MAVIVKYSIRLLLQSPGFTITAVAALALGIGATTAIFSIVNTVLLKPLPVSDPNRLVMLVTTGVSDTGESESDIDASLAKFAHWRAQSSVLQEVSGFLTGVVNYTSGDVVEQWRSLQVSAEFFRCWSLRMVRGRTFTPEEDSPNGPRAALSARAYGRGVSQGIHKSWARRFRSTASRMS
jgi:putative ABC transport system permease protein